MINSWIEWEMKSWQAGGWQQAQGGGSGHSKRPAARCACCHPRREPAVLVVMLRPRICNSCSFHDEDKKGEENELRKANLPGGQPQRRRTLPPTGHSMMRAKTAPHHWI